MPHSIVLKDRIEALVKGWPKVEEKPMFGGIAYMIGGHMAFGVYANWLIVRVGEDLAGKRLGEAGVRPLDITGKPMKDWLMVDESHWGKEEDLVLWLHLARDFVAGLPPGK